MSARGTRPGTLNKLAVQTGVRIEKSVHEWLLSESERLDVSVGQLIRDALDAAKTKAEKSAAARKARREGVSS